MFRWLLLGLLGVVVTAADAAAPVKNTWMPVSTFAEISGCSGAYFADVHLCWFSWAQGNIGTGGGDCSFELADPVVYHDTGPYWTGAVSTEKRGTMNSSGNPCTAEPGATFVFWDACEEEGEGYYFEDDPNVGGCLEEFDCSIRQGVQVDRFFSGSSVGASVCTFPGGTAPGAETATCAAAVVGFASCSSGGECYARLEFTGSSCTTEEDITDDGILVDEPGDVNCVSGGGVIVCARQDAQNCGTVNGQSVCLDKIPDGRCTFLGNGGMVCASDATAPPIPTEEDGVTAAEPDGSFVAKPDGGATREFLYFGPGTVASSPTGSSGSGQSGTVGGSGGSGGLPGDDEGEEEYPDICVGGECDLELPEIEEGEEPGTVVGDALSSMTGGPFGDVLAGLELAAGAGECPTATLEFWGEAYVVDSHCALVEEQRAVIEAVMLLVWVLFGIRILMET